MRVVIESPIEPNGQLPIVKHAKTGRNCIVLGFPIGVLVRVDENPDPDAFRKRMEFQRSTPTVPPLFFAVDAKDPGLAGVWVREPDLTKVGP
jgi:hypothetical protein